VGDNRSEFAEAASWRGGRYEYYDDWNEWQRTRAIIGLSYMALGTLMRTMPPQTTTVVIQERTYYYTEDTYFQKTYHGSEVAYEAITPPVGATVDRLPQDYTRLTLNGTVYYAAGGIYYHQIGSVYEVVPEPF